MLAFALVSTFTPRAIAHPPTALTTAAEKAVADEILAFRKQMAQAIAAKDMALLRTMYADTFQHTHTSGTVDRKDAHIVSALANEPVVETAPHDDISIQVHAGGWTAVAYGMSPIKAMSDGKIYAVRWLQVYTRNDKSWQLVASQATRSHEIKP
jgi:ketosteroid isomerase-like protein